MVVGGATCAEKGEHTSYQKWIGDDSSIQDTVHLLQSAGPLVQERTSTQPVTTRVDCRESVVKADTPVGQVGEITERLFRRAVPGAGTAPYQHKDHSSKRVEPKESANEEQGLWREQP